MSGPGTTGSDDGGFWVTGDLEAPSLEGPVSVGVVYGGDGADPG
jgi:hypothetical protein